MDDWPDPGRQLRFLVVEDDQEIAAVMQRILRTTGADARIAPDGQSAIEQVSTFKPDVVLLDLGLPQVDGVEVARQLRQMGNDVPIIAVTARDASEARVEGLDAGADDYVIKPFEKNELLARIRAVLRRRPPKGAAAITVGPLTLDPDARLASISGRPVELTAREFELLEFMMRNRGVVISRQQLLDEVWGYDPLAETNTIEVFISNLRRKLEDGGEDRVLKTVRGTGYVIRA